MKKTILMGLMCLGVSLNISAQRFELPDIKGEYYFSGDELKEITSEISDTKKLQLFVNTKDVRDVQVLRVSDKLTVVDIVTYFVDVLVSEPNRPQPKRMEMVLVENLSNNRIRLELETGEEWIRPPVISDP